MDGREAMSFSGSSVPYYMHRGGVIGGSGNASGGFLQPSSGFRILSNGSDGSTFSVEPQQHASYSHGISTGSSPGPVVPSSGEPMKRKRGRPRKYGPDGTVSLRLSPLSPTENSTPGSTSPSQKRPRGRPPGSGRKQQLAALGMYCILFLYEYYQILSIL